MKLIQYSLLLIPFRFFAQAETVLADWKKDPALLYSTYGYCVTDVRTGEVLSAHNPKQAMIPASTLKLFTTAAACKKLGPKFRYETRIYYTGSIDKKTGILTGDIIIMGGGDPTLHSERFGNEPGTAKWAEAIAKKGIRQIKGNIIADGSAFPRQVNGSWLYEDVSNYFGSSASGLNFHDNKFTVIFESQAENALAKITGYSPQYMNRPFEFSSSVYASGTEDQAYVMGDPFSYTRTVVGTIPANKKNYEVDAALPDPALLCAEFLIRDLEKAGVKCEQKNAWSIYTSIKPRTDLYLIHTHYSPILDEIIQQTNLHSINLYAESLLLSLGKGNRESGIREVKTYLAELGLDSSQVYMKDGCGLSRINYCTPELLTGLLTKIAQDSVVYKAVERSLPQAGRQGSMTSVGKGTYLVNKMRAKTGYVTKARAYAGYIRTRKGKELAFTVMLSNYNCSAREARAKLEKLMVTFADL